MKPTGKVGSEIDERSTKESAGAAEVRSGVKDLRSPNQAPQRNGYDLTSYGDVAGAVG